jgi:flavodoxin I
LSHGKPCQNQVPKGVKQAKIFWHIRQSFLGSLLAPAIGEPYTIPVPSLHFLYASTSGHTEFVVDTLITFLKSRQPRLVIERTRADQAKPEDLLRGDVLVLASGTWNTGGIEGQLNPYLHMLLKEKAAGIELKGKKVALIALGDARYRYTAGAGAHMQEFVKSHGGELVGEALIIVNEPYGQEKAVEEWGKNLLSKLSTL